MRSLLTLLHRSRSSGLPDSNAVEGQARRHARGVFRRNRRGAVALEFAICFIPFLTFTLFIFEISYDLFVQEVLDNALQASARAVQTGNAQNVPDQATFIANQVCPNFKGLLECDKVAINVASVPGDYYAATTGTVPTSNGKLDTSGFKFCNGAPQQPMLITALYSGPTFLNGLLPGLFSISNGTDLVHPTLAGVGFINEPFPPTAGAGGAASC